MKISTLHLLSWFILLANSCARRSVSEEQIPANGPKAFAEIKGFWLEESMAIDRGNNRGDSKPFAQDEGRIHGFGDGKYNRFVPTARKFQCPFDQEASLDQGLLKILPSGECRGLDSVLVKSGPKSLQWIDARMVKETRILTRYVLVPLSDSQAKLYAPLFKEDTEGKSEIFKTLPHP